MKNRIDIGICLILAAAVIWIYWPVQHHDFVSYDDPVYVSDNRNVAAGLTPASIRWAFTTTVGSNWHPVTWVSHILDVQLFGLDPGWHHGVNVLIHLINGLLCYAVFHRMTKKRFAAFMVAALFVVHPMRVESVAWISERKDVLSALFGWLALGAYIRYVAEPSKARYGWIVVFFCLGLMSKPMLVTFPFVLLLLDYWPLGRLTAENHAGQRLFGLLKEKGPLLCLSAGASLIALVAQARGGSIGTTAVFPLSLRMANALQAYAAYIKKMLAPYDLACLYPYQVDISAGDLWGAALLLAIISGVCIRLRKVRPYLIVGWLWYLGTLVPVIGIVQIGSQAMADRYAYLPFVGLFIMLAFTLSDVYHRNRKWRTVLALGIVAVLLFFSGMARVQAGFWKDTVTLFQRAIAVTNNNYAAHTSLGIAYAEMGQLDKAIAHYQEAIKINSGYAKAYHNLAVSMDKKGNTKDAVKWYEKALEVNPNLAETRFNLGQYYASQGELEKAAEYYAVASQSGPHIAAIWFERANLSIRINRFNEAIEFYQKTLAIDPQFYAAHQHLGNVYLQLDRVGEAVHHYQKALQLNPDHPALLNNLGIAMIRIGDVGAGIRYFKQALRADPADPDALRNLKKAEALAGSK